MSLCRGFCAVAAVFAVMLQPAALAQSGRVLPIRTLLAGPRLGPGTAQAVSPNGKWVAYTVVHGRPDGGAAPSAVPWYGFGGEVWITRVADGLTRRVAQAGASHWLPSWSPNGRYLAFLSDRGHAGQNGAIRLWLWDSASQTIRQASIAPLMDPWGRLGRLEWLADGRTVVVKMQAAGYVDEPEVADSGVTVELFEGETRGEIVRAGPNTLSHLSGDLAVLNVEDGTFIRIARGLQLCSYALSPDRRMLAYAVATGYDRPGSYQILVDLFVTDLLTRTTRRLIAAAPLVYAFPNYPVFAWSPDSRAIAYRTDGPSGTKDEVYVVRVDGGAPVRIAGNHVLEEPLLAGRPLWDRAGQRLFFVREGALWQAASDGRTPSRQLASLPGRSLRMVEHGSGALWSPDQGRSSVVITGDHRETASIQGALVAGDRAGRAAERRLSGRS